MLYSINTQTYFKEYIITPKYLANTTYSKHSIKCISVLANPHLILISKILSIFSFLLAKDRHI